MKYLPIIIIIILLITSLLFYRYACNNKTYTCIDGTIMYDRKLMIQYNTTAYNILDDSLQGLVNQNKMATYRRDDLLFKYNQKIGKLEESQK